MPATCRCLGGRGQLLRNTGDSRSLHGGRASHACAHSKRLQHRLERPGEAREVAVVDAAVVELIGEFAQQPRPVSPSRFQGDADLHPSLDDLDRGPARGGRLGLFPRAVATGGRAPLGNRSSASRSDQPAAPNHRRSRRPVDRGRRRHGGFAPRELRRVGALHDRCADAVAVHVHAAWPCPPDCRCFSCPEAAHQPPVTRHHDWRNLRCIRCVPLDLGHSLVVEAGTVRSRAVAGQTFGARPGRGQLTACAPEISDNPAALHRRQPAGDLEQILRVCRHTHRYDIDSADAAPPALQSRGIAMPDYRLVMGHATVLEFSEPQTMAKPLDAPANWRWNFRRVDVSQPGGATFGWSGRRPAAGDSSWLGSRPPSAHWSRWMGRHGLPRSGTRGGCQGSARICGRIPPRCRHATERETLADAVTLIEVRSTARGRTTGSRPSRRGRRQSRRPAARPSWAGLSGSGFASAEHADRWARWSPRRAPGSAGRRSRASRRS